MVTGSNPVRPTIIKGEILKSKSTGVYVNSYASCIDIYISEELGHPSRYIDMLEQIRNSRESDIVKLHINSPGGRLDTAIQFIRVIREANGLVTCSIEGMCASASTLIFLSADSFEVSEHSMFMIHNYSGGLFGKGHELNAQIDFERDWVKTLMNDVYKDFLDELEIKQVLDGKDIWMDSEEVHLRCQLLVEAREAKSHKETR